MNNSRLFILSVVMTLSVGIYAQSDKLIWVSESMIDQSTGESYEFKSRFEASFQSLIWYQPGGRTTDFNLTNETWSWDGEQETGTIHFSYQSGDISGTVDFNRTSTIAEVTLTMTEAGETSSFLIPIVGLFKKEQ